MRRFGIVALVLAFVCAGTGAALAEPKPLPLSARVIQPGEFPGFLAGQSTTLYRDPKKWVSIDTTLTAAQVSAQTARMRGEGFVAALSRELVTQMPKHWGGLSWVMQLNSDPSARAELRANVREAARTSKPPSRTYKAFPVSGIPGARGYRLSSPGGAGDNIVFADQQFLYFVGFGWSGKAQNRPTRAQLLAAAVRLYKRTRGHPPA